MKSVVVISYNFPPDGSAGVYRPLRFVRHLPDMGWHPTVVASGNTHQGRNDPGLLSLVPDHVEVVRVPGADAWQRFQAWRARRSFKMPSGSPPENVREINENPPPSMRSYLRSFVRKAESYYYHPDLAMPWITPGMTATVKVCQRTGAKVIWVTGGPWSSFVVARKASLHTGVPYVLDFRDSWTLAGSPFDDDRPGWAKRRDRRLLYQIFEGAQAVIFRYHSEAECYWRAYPGALELSRIHIIPNGFDGTIAGYNPDPGNQTTCVVLYAGTIAPYRYDTLLQGIRLLKQSSPVLAGYLQLLFVGEGTEAINRAAGILGVLDVVKIMSAVSYAEVCRLQTEANALLLLGLIPMKGYELCGSKVFSYLKAGRPIIGILPQDEMKTVLHRVGVRTIADIDSPSEIATVFRQVLEAWREGTLSSFVPDRKSSETYSAKQQTLALVRALEGAPPVDPFVPGSVEIPLSLQGDIGKAGWV
ncbi:glycosyltransferase [uncultured Nitrospira sp.]|uniref:glycosyltransferase n=1 Tax=uncultured Nitrospira sp. TaxID=157176 RepID=UPI003140928E